MKINILNTGPHDLPEYKTEESAGLDLQAVLEENISLDSLEISRICFRFTILSVKVCWSVGNTKICQWVLRSNPE